jgi:hypothetical protein
MKDARRAEAEARAEAARLRAELEAKAQPAQKQQPFYTAQQLEQMVLSGQITQAVAADQLAWQRAQLAKNELKQEVAVEERLRTARGEVSQYLTKVEALRDPSSPEFQRVSEAAYELAADMNLPVSDPRVQRAALRQVHGPIDKVVNVQRQREFSRANADTHTETAGGAGGAAPARDPLKQVPAHIMEHWKKRGYTKDEMMAELPYVRLRRSR